MPLKAAAASSRWDKGHPPKSWKTLWMASLTESSKPQISWLLLALLKTRALAKCLIFQGEYVLVVQQF
jgi:hypothetical protein